MKKLPSDSDIRALHEKYAPSREALDLVYGHCQIVWEIAWQLIQRNDLPLNVATVRAGCLLHDIGVYRLYENGVISGGYIRHGVLGEEILRQEDFPEVLWRIASHHTGVGIRKEEIITDNLPLPPQDYLAETAEERLVMYADKFHSKTTPPQFNSAAWYAQEIARFGEKKRQAFLQMVAEFGEPNLRELADRYGFSVR